MSSKGFGFSSNEIFRKWQEKDRRLLQLAERMQRNGMFYESWMEKREVTELMTDLLLPLKNHCNENTKAAIDFTLLVLTDMEVNNANCD